MKIFITVLLFINALDMTVTFPHRSLQFMQGIISEKGWPTARTYGSTSTQLQLTSDMTIGSVTLVGSGPGDPDLLTVQAFKLLKNASLVVSDRLVSKEILALIDCEVKVANKRPGCAEEAQAELNEWVIDAALKGRNVVRLKIGDPFLFGRGLPSYIVICMYCMTYATMLIPRRGRNS